MLELTQENYFSKEADNEYMSVSQYKLFEKCEANALAVLNSETTAEQKVAYLEGHLFETIVAGDIDLFMMQHPELVASRGATVGELKANYKKVVNAANKIKNQKFIMDIVNRCEKQVILTGEISGVKVKCCLDLFDKENKQIYDLKCMANFKEQWNDKDKCYIEWFWHYGYILQMAVYREIVKQNFGIDCETHLIAATKEDEPDIDAFTIPNNWLDFELDLFKNNVFFIDKIKKGIDAPKECGHCDYCKAHKKITEFREVF